MQKYPLAEVIPPYQGIDPEPEQLLEAFMSYLETKGLELYEAQEEAILELLEDKNVILNTPTGSGKSLVALALHFKSLASGRRSIYTCPIKALVNEKFLALCKEFGPENVGMVTGDASVNKDALILCCTAEILANLSLREGEKTEIDHVIMDEFHYYSDEERGVAWQVPLLTLPHARFLLMSATIGDVAPFEKSLKTLTQKPAVTVRSDDRPVPLDFSYSTETLDQTISDLLSSSKAPIYIVHFTQREATQNAQSFMSLKLCSKEEKKAISEELKLQSFKSPFGKELKRYILHGIGVHHAGLLPKYRILVEKLAQKGLLKIICGTDTLGVGVNVPIRTVLFTKLCKYDGKKTSLLTSRDFHQIAGRAGRKGFDDQGSVICQAPEHVIENLKLEAKAGGDAKKKKRIVRKKPPEKGYVHWDEETFKKLIEKEPEPLRSQFQVSHGMLLNVLSRETNGCAAMKNLVRTCHSSDIIKSRLRKRSFQLFRSLIEGKIVEFIPKDERVESPVRVNITLQDDFSLNQSLSLFLLSALEGLNPESENFSIDLMTLAESILENPRVVLLRQRDKARTIAIASMKEQGMEYEERMEELEKIEHPKPNEEIIYESFNEFSRKHPWVGAENIKPKSIAREMYENYMSFHEYVKEYGLEKAEGVLLRYLTQAYKVVVQTVPDALKNDAISELELYLESIIRRTDSSLLDEWQKMKDPNWAERALEGKDDVDESMREDITKNEKKFTIMIRNLAFSFMRSIAVKDLELASQLLENSEACNSDFLEEQFAMYFEAHTGMLTTHEARGKEYTKLEKTSPTAWSWQQTILDPENEKDWFIDFSVDVEKSADKGEVSLKFERLVNL